MTLEAMVERIQYCGWTFSISHGETFAVVDSHQFKSGQVSVVDYRATVVTAVGEASWTGKTPADALAGALSGAEAMHGVSS